jgi:hypothetical protein
VGYRGTANKVTQRRKFTVNEMEKWSKFSVIVSPCLKFKSGASWLQVRTECVIKVTSVAQMHLNRTLLSVSSKHRRMHSNIWTWRKYRKHRRLWQRWCVAVLQADYRIYIRDTLQEEETFQIVRKEFAGKETFLHGGGTKCSKRNVV